jgi:hypothetical protein
MAHLTVPENGISLQRLKKEQIRDNQNKKTGG